MLKNRIIPCLDIKDGKTVKGINFKSIKTVGDPVELAQRYEDEGADELVFLDISATDEKRSTLVSLVDKIAKAISIPFTVGGGISNLEIAQSIMDAGADKISINSAAVKNPDLLSELSNEIGSQSVVLAIDALRYNNEWRVTTHGAKKTTELKVKEWIQKGQLLGIGEILLTSIRADGTKDGFDLELYNTVSRITNLPIIASGGAGSKKHFELLFKNSEVKAGLAASIFHYKEISIPELKAYLKSKSIAIR